MKKISLTILSYHFTFNCLAIVLAAGGFILLCSLGVWQLHRADDKKQWIEAAQRHLQESPLSLQDIQKSESLNYYPINLKGSYVSGHVIFLDNKIYQHQVGYQILVPFAPEANASWVWVNRGWIPRGKSRNSLPEIILPKGQRVLTGLIHVPGKSGFILGENIEKRSQQVWRAQSLQIAGFSRALGHDFYPFEVLLVSDAAGDSGLGILDWKPSVSVEPARHIAYAVQWFGLAGVFLVIFILMHAQRFKKS